MERYEVLYEWLNENGEEREDVINDNGRGFSHEEAQHIALELQYSKAVDIIYAVARRM